MSNPSEFGGRSDPQLFFPQVWPPLVNYVSLQIYAMGHFWIVTPLLLRVNEVHRPVHDAVKAGH